MIFKRKIYNKLLEWKKASDGSTALLVEGARRVGKSSIVEEFAKREYASYVLVDFSKAQSKLKRIFNEYLSRLGIGGIALPVWFRFHLKLSESIMFQRIP